MNHSFLVTQRQNAASAAAQDDLNRPRLVVTRGPEKEAGIRDTASVDVRNWHSLSYWARWLGINEQQLIRATRVAGTNVAAIEAHLAERRERRLRKRAAAALQSG